MGCMALENGIARNIVVEEIFPSIVRSLQNKRDKVLVQIFSLFFVPFDDFYCISCYRTHHVDRKCLYSLSFFFMFLFLQNFDFQHDVKTKQKKSN